MHLGTSTYYVTRFSKISDPPLPSCNKKPYKSLCPYIHTYMQNTLLIFFTMVTNRWPLLPLERYVICGRPLNGWKLRQRQQFDVFINFLDFSLKKAVTNYRGGQPKLICGPHLKIIDKNIDLLDRILKKIPKISRNNWISKLVWDEGWAHLC